MAVQTKSQRDIPTNGGFTPYVILALHNQGGSAKAESVRDEIIRLMNIDQATAERKMPSGQTIVNYRIRWARQMLADTGHLDKDAPRGVWALTPQAEGRVSELDTDENRDQFAKEVAREYNAARSTKGEGAGRSE